VAIAQSWPITAPWAKATVPAFPLGDLGDEGVAFGDLDPVPTTLELAEEDLAQVGQHGGIEAEPLRQRRRGFLRAPQVGDEGAGEPLVGQLLRHRDRLRPADLRQRRVALAVDQRKSLARQRRFGGTVADDDDLHRVGRWHVAVLLEPARLGRRFAHPATDPTEGESPGCPFA
jgi:hypothetical protein